MFLSCKVFHPEPFKNSALPPQPPARKPYRRSSIRQQPQIYRGPAVMHSATAWGSTCPRFNFAESSVKTDTRDAGTGVYAGSTASLTFEMNKTVS